VDCYILAPVDGDILAQGLLELIEYLGMKTVSEFFGIPKTVSGFSRSDLSVSVFFGIGIGCRNLSSESVSKSVRRFTDRFYRIPILIGILPDSAVGISGTKATFQPTQPMTTWADVSL
jgi:hypothetical protein